MYLKQPRFLPRIVLASTSPQRKRLLKQIRIPFRCVTPDIDETVFSDLAITDRVVQTAKAKVESVLPFLHPKTRWIVGVDTLIELGGEIIGKPADRNEAERILMRLSGNVHQVYTGIALLHQSGKTWQCTSVTSVVKMTSMTEKEVEFYLVTNEWKGAAGAYRIQETGAIFVESIEGSYSNVVGLPLSDFYGMLGAAEYPIP